MPQETIGQARQNMEKSVTHLQGELSKLRTGRASTALLDGLMVEAYGSSMPLNQVGTLSVPESRLIVIAPWDKGVIPDIEKAILKSDLGLTPSSDGKIVRIPMPPLNEERRKELVKHAKKLAEEGRVSIRNARRDANEQLRKLQKDKSLSEDDIKREEQEVQKLTDQYVRRIDEVVQKKEKEIMEV